MEDIDIKEALKIIKKGVAEIVPEDDLEKKLVQAKEQGKSLTIKLGLDPSAPDIHIRTRSSSKKT